MYTCIPSPRGLAAGAGCSMAMLKYLTKRARSPSSEPEPCSVPGTPGGSDSADHFESPQRLPTKYTKLSPSPGDGDKLDIATCLDKAGKGKLTTAEKCGLLTNHLVPGPDHRFPKNSKTMRSFQLKWLHLYKLRLHDLQLSSLSLLPPPPGNRYRQSGCHRWVCPLPPKATTTGQRSGRYDEDKDESDWW